MRQAGTARLPGGWLLAGVVSVIGVSLLAAATGPAGLPPGRVLRALLDALPAVSVDSGLGERELAILWEVRLPRVVLGLLVGSSLATAGAAYQGVFRNPLADPYLLGVAAGAGLGATFAIVAGHRPILPLAAFVGGAVAVILTYLLGRGLGDRTVTGLILAGVAVASFFAAWQTYLQQRHDDTLREVYAWILGRLSTSGWREVLLVAPYVAVSIVTIVLHRRLLDVLSVGDSEAAGLGLSVGRVRLAVVAAATLGTASAVAVSGLIGFVGIIVPHTVRLAAGASYRRVVPLSVLFGGSFLVAADLAARSLLAPAELPIGVVTAFLGAPFFLVVLRTSRRVR